MWTIAAPASPRSMAAGAISCGVVGKFGFWALRGHDPVVAAEMISASEETRLAGLARSWAGQRSLLQESQPIP